MKRVNCISYWNDSCNGTHDRCLGQQPSWHEKARQARNYICRALWCYDGSWLRARDIDGSLDPEYLTGAYTFTCLSVLILHCLPRMSPKNYVTNAMSRRSSSSKYPTIPRTNNVGYLRR